MSGINHHHHPKPCGSYRQQAPDRCIDYTTTLHDIVQTDNCKWFAAQLQAWTCLGDAPTTWGPGKTAEELGSFRRVRLHFMCFFWRAFSVKIGRTIVPPTLAPVWADFAFCCLFGSLSAETSQSKAMTLKPLVPWSEGMTKEALATNLLEIHGNQGSLNQTRTPSWLWAALDPCKSHVDPMYCNLMHCRHLDSLATTTDVDSWQEKSHYHSGLGLTQIRHVAAAGHSSFWVGQLVVN